MNFDREQIFASSEFALHALKKTLDGLEEARIAPKLIPTRDRCELSGRDGRVASAVGTLCAAMH